MTTIRNRSRILTVSMFLWLCAASNLVTAEDPNLNAADDYNPEALKSGRVDPSLHLQQGSNQLEAQKINPVIYKATGFGNTFMVITDEGNVIIDTSLPGMAVKHKSLLNAVNDGPIHSIIITHGHGDHTGGVALWREPETKVIAQQNMVEFLRYQKRLKGLFIQRNSAQFGFDLTSTSSSAASESSGVNMLPNTLFDKRLNFTLGQEKFEVLHTPAETYDALTVWMPEHKAAFVGDLFYRSFPNIYTLRGTKPRWALDYINSINRVLALGPEILLPSHGEPILGNENINAEMTRYRDAIQYVHDETVKGMNEGRDVYSLMREIKLPKALDVGEAYGWVSWSVRGIYEGYMGWFDGDPVSMYAQSPQSIYADLVTLAGGAEKVISLAEQHLNNGDSVKALLLIEAAMDTEPDNQAVLSMRLQILRVMRKASGNLNESGWLNHGIKQTQQKLSFSEDTSRK
ncbi:MAG: alkyl sulfatase BDS1-like metallo-beta-lactamase superfamily hydrolase [Porticoccaceae bacterium]|jgi:alkyl sulfatase BDS1-like metallo-beta-lactamase superfamily hydrolase